MNTRRCAALTLGVLLLATPFVTHAADRTDDDGEFDVYVKAEVQAPAANAVFHTGGAAEVNVDYRSVHSGKVTSDGTQTVNTSWRVIHLLELTPTEILGMANTQGTGDLQIAANTTATVQFNKTFDPTFPTPDGGHTAIANSTVQHLTAGYDNHNINDSRSLTVVNP